MPLLAYIEKNVSHARLAVIATARDIIAEYQAQGLSLTLRQLYYQFVARDLIPNSQREYKRLGNTISDGRLLGYLDWGAIEDRTRRCMSWSTFNSPAEAVRHAASSYLIDRWKNQPCYVEVWVEKEALAGVIGQACEEYDLPHVSCKGYMSQSAIWEAGHYRIRKAVARGQEPVVIHLGDHDPSGIDMTRDIQARLSMFAQGYVEVDRIALNYDQVEEHGCPPNPAKMTDSRAKDYVLEHGYDSWELDALEPATLVELIRQKVEAVLDRELWDEDTERWEAERAELVEMAKEYDEEHPA